MPPTEPPDLVARSARLWLRRWRDDDLSALLAVYGDAEAMRFVGDGQPLDEAGARRWLQVTADNYRLRGYGMTALVARDTGDTVGFAGLVHPGGQPECEVKYAIDRRCWGQGFATEAVRALLALAGDGLGLTRVIATVDADHAASQRVLSRAGLVLNQRRPDPPHSDVLVFEWRPPGA